MDARKLIKIKNAKVAPLRTLEARVHSDGYCPAHLFQARRGYEQVPLHSVVLSNETNNGTLRKSLSQSEKPRLQHESKVKDVYKYSSGDNSAQKNNIAKKTTEIEGKKKEKKEIEEEHNLNALRELRSRFMRNTRKFIVSKISD